MVCYNTSCSTPTAGISSFTAAVQYFAAAQCLISEGVYPEANIKSGDKFDFIIVGAGSAGCVLANRLSEVKDWNILLIEAGGDPPQEASIPAYAANLWLTKYNWGYKTTNDGIRNQAFINGSVSWPRGKLIGGSSNVNALIYMQGIDSDYQKWCDAGNKEWCINDVRRCLNKAENFQDMKLSKNFEIYNNYGHDGPLIINTFNSTYRSITQKILSAYDEIGFKNVEDLNVAEAFGSGVMRVTASNGERNSVSKAYLKPIKGRCNLKILKNALVTKVLVNIFNKAYGVLVEHNGKRIIVKSTKEVIISAGSINSPQLLMLSGIGPRQELEHKNIPTVTNLPLVGQKLQDHSLFPIPIYTDDPNDKITEADIYFDTIKYLYNRTGYLAQITFSDILAFYSLDKNATQPDFEIYLIRVPRNTTSVKEDLIAQFKYKDGVASSFSELNKNHTLYFFQISLLHPHSNGNISLKSNNPREFPYIYPNYFSDPRDLEIVVSGIQEFVKILNTTFFKSHGGFLGRINWPDCDPFELNSRDYWRCMCISLTGTVYHPVGTCKMGSNKTDSVVNSRLKVHGVQNLRVIDASIMPDHVSGNTNGPVVMIGERGAELIKEDYGKV